MNHAERAAGLVTRRGFLGTALGAGIAGSMGLLAGCSSASGSSGDGGGGDAAIKIINTSAVGSFAINNMLKTGGYFKKAGVNATITNVSAGNQVLAAVGSGSADVTMLSGMISVFPAIDKGLKLKVLGGTEVVSTSAIFSGNPAVKSVRDLSGKTIGVGAVGSELYDVFSALLTKYNISPSKVTFRNVGSSADSFKAVLAKQIDVGYGQVGNQATAGKHGVRMIATVNQELPLWINQGAVASVSAIASKHDSLVKVLAAYASLFRYLATAASKADYVAAYTAAGGSAAEAALEWKFLNSNTAYSPALTLPENKMNFIQQQNVKNGTQSKVLAYSSYTDFSLRGDALASLKK
jgi:ABC-type nitrate/sulfonate/bicarbonate transport system substrate-binding protein